MAAGDCKFLENILAFTSNISVGTNARFELPGSELQILPELPILITGW